MASTTCTCGCPMRCKLQPSTVCALGSRTTHTAVWRPVTVTSARTSFARTRSLRRSLREVMTAVQIFLVLSSSLNPSGATSDEMGAHIAKHGDGVRDVAFVVDDCKVVFEVPLLGEEGPGGGNVSRRPSRAVLWWCASRGRNLMSTAQ